MNWTQSQRQQLPMHKNVSNILPNQTKPKKSITAKKTKKKKVKPSQSNKINKSMNKLQKKADSQWRNGDLTKTKNKSNGTYPEWWPKDDEIEQNEQQPEPIIDDDDESEEVYSDNVYAERPEVQHPNVYNQPIAFSVPKQNFGKDANDNCNVQVHVNLYPEYMQKCLDPNAETKIETNERLNQSECRTRNGKSKQSRDRARSLTRCTESSQAKLQGVRPQSAYLKSVNRDIAPCLKRKKKSNPIPIQKKKKNKKQRSLYGACTPKYLQNVQSKIKKDLKRDRMRNLHAQNEKEDLLKNIAKYGMNEHANDQYVDEWRAQFGYNRMGRDEIDKPSAISVADAMMQSEVIQAIDPSMNKKPMLLTSNLLDFDTNIADNDLSNENQDPNETMTTDMNFLTDLRDWASGLVDNVESD